MIENSGTSIIIKKTENIKHYVCIIIYCNIALQK